MTWKRRWWIIVFIRFCSPVFNAADCLAHCYFCGTKLNVILVITFTSQDLYSYKEKGHLKAKGVKRNHDRDC